MWSRAVSIVQTVNCGIFNCKVLLVREDVQLLRIGAKFHVIPLWVGLIWSWQCERPHGRVIHWFCGSQKPPLFSPAGVKSALQICSPLFCLKVYYDDFIWCDFSLSASAVWIFCLFGAFWCQFSVGPVRFAETSDILYSLEYSGVHINQMPPA